MGSVCLYVYTNERGEKEGGEENIVMSKCCGRDVTKKLVLIKN